jgi:hypothetical protein
LPARSRRVTSWRVDSQNRTAHRVALLHLRAREAPWHGLIIGALAAMVVAALVLPRPFGRYHVAVALAGTLAGWGAGRWRQRKLLRQQAHVIAMLQISERNQPDRK